MARTLAERCDTGKANPGQTRRCVRCIGTYVASSKKNGGALVSTFGSSHVLHAGEVCDPRYQSRQKTNANYDEELALAA